MTKKRNEQTSPRVGSIASKLLKSGKGTAKEIRTVAATALTQRPDRSKRK